MRVWSRRVVESDDTEQREAAAKCLNGQIGMAIAVLDGKREHTLSTFGLTLDVVIPVGAIQRRRPIRAQMVVTHIEDAVRCVLGMNPRAIAIGGQDCVETIGRIERYLVNDLCTVAEIRRIKPSLVRKRCQGAIHRIAQVGGKRALRAIALATDGNFRAERIGLKAADDHLIQRQGAGLVGADE